ncbi:Hsp70 family protein [Microbacterium sp. gxy059]|uniref:Hsp70 family protein n=1 Tax=Microbacterium sp. gxy059 TaxID=2957199 RepID=UPI003D99E291
MGIDLGTTYSAVAVVEATGVPRVVNNGEGSAITPSVVLFKNAKGKDEPVVGGAAKRQAGLRPDDVVQHVKRYMGDPSWRFDSSNDESYRPEEVSAIILRALVRAAEAELGETIDDVVITVPAYFDDSRRTATRQAGEIAGLNVLRVLNEPTAAALSYGLSSDDDGIVLVYDLGGGTFDVTILGIEDSRFEVLATDGDRNLGGLDWDNALMKLVVDELEATHGVTDFWDDVDAVALLREKTEQAKRALSAVETTSIQLSLDIGHFSVDVTREGFEAATKSLLRRTQELVEDTLDESGLDWDDIDSVLLVGGSTRMPAVSALLARLSGANPVEGVNPDEAVALGAAIQAGIETGGEGDLSDVVIEDVTSQALGTVAQDDDGVDRNWVVIERNTKVPATGEQILTTLSPRTELHVWVTQGDDPDIDFTTEIGHGVFPLEEEWPTGTDFRVVYHYDIDQTVTVEVFRLPEDLLVGVFEIDRVANLTEEAVEAAAAKVGAMGADEAAAPAESAPAAPSVPTKPSGLPTLPTAASQSTAPAQTSAPAPRPSDR